MDPTRPTRSALPLRALLVAGLALVAAAVFVALLLATDTALSVWERLRDAPAWLRWSIGGLLGGFAGFSAWLVWRLWRGPARPRPRGPAPSRDALEQRLLRLPAEETVAPLRDELVALDARAAGGELHVALYGEVGAGKTSLLRALSGRDDLATGVLGGTTRAVAQVRAHEYVYADAPGLDEPGGAARADAARAEAVRAHAVVDVCDGDLTRAQDTALERLLALGKPTLLALNKTDRYTRSELSALLGRLRERYGERALVVAVRSGGTEPVVRRLPDGREERVERERPPETAALVEALDALTAAGAAALEPGRRAAVLRTLAERLESVEDSLRARDADAVVSRYTRRAIVGAMAAIAPGTDLLIQGALALALLRELTGLYGLGLRDVDLDRFVERAGGTLRGTTAVALAIAGNALKAFPGLGTVGGGLLHAVAYGMVFDSLGRAVAATLAERGRLADEEALQRFEDSLRRPDTDRLRALVRVAADALTRPRE